MSATTPFDPTRHLSRVSGSEYLEVKWRLVWLRDRHPDADIITDCEDLADKKAICKATITIPGGGSSTGFGSETPGDFRDYLEKAETKAIGRALAALGFGTQFCADHEFGAAIGRVVDSPVTPRGMAHVPAKQPPSTAPGEYVDRPPKPERQVVNGYPVGGADHPATQRQLRYLHAIAREKGLDVAALDERALLEFGAVATALSRRDASDLIDRLSTDAPPQRNGHRADPVEASQRAPAIADLPEGGEDDGAPISSTLITAIWTNAAQYGFTAEAVKAAVARNFGGKDIGSLTRGEARRVVADIATAKTP